MNRKIKVGLTLIILGSILLYSGYNLLGDFREREEETTRIEEEETVTEHGGIIAMNFCGGIFLIGGIVIILVKVLDIQFGKEDL